MGDVTPTRHIWSPNEASSDRKVTSKPLLSKELPKNIGYCKVYQLLSTNWQLGSIAEDNTFRTHWTQKFQTGAYMLPKEKDKYQARYKTSNVQ